MEILDGWSGKITWELLCAKISATLGAQYDYSRFTLGDHPRIKAAFDLRKDAARGMPSGGPRVPRDERLRAAFEQIERLKAKAARLDVENRRLLEQFHVWAINAERGGISMDNLNKALAKPQREQSRVERDGDVPNNRHRARGRLPGSVESRAGQAAAGTDQVAEG
ncbi:hypothetical protein [Ramlibacter pinisoli]|uniref:hypothetical protein n=1 Tax=Ramlibacter pinisoli TaxID=2682844 RepID=UPI0018DF216B|nr:hypothetical protein [Ramlibacter pinisoli]